VTADLVTIAQTASDATASAAPDHVIAIPAAVTELFKKEKATTEFLAAGRKRRPRMPDGYHPKKNDQVVAQWSEGSWYAGKVDAIAGERATVSWLGSSFKPSEVQLTRIAPYPSAAATEELASGAYVLVKGPGNGAWQYAQVAAVDGKNVDVTFANGSTQTIRPGEFLVLE
jgi:hypothetical protein